MAPGASPETQLKETLSLLGRITQNHAGVQQKLLAANAHSAYSSLLFAQMHDSAIAELAALALVNLAGEVPPALTAVQGHPRWSAIRWRLGPGSLCGP